MMPKLQWLLIGSALTVAAHPLRGATATPRRHLRGAATHRVLHTDDFTETVVDNQWLVLLGILLLMGSGSAWNYCLLLTCCSTCEGRPPLSFGVVSLPEFNLSTLDTRGGQLPDRYDAGVRPPPLVGAYDASDGCHTKPSKPNRAGFFEVCEQVL